MLPRRAGRRPDGARRRGPDPEAELRARLLLYRAYRDAGRRLADGALGRGSACSGASPAAARAAGLAGARPADAPPLDPSRLVGALDAPRRRSRRHRRRRPRSCRARSR